MISQGPFLIATAQALTSAYAAFNTTPDLNVKGYDFVGLNIAYTSNAAGAGGGYPTIEIIWTFIDGTSTPLGLKSAAGSLQIETYDLPGPGVVNTTITYLLEPKIPTGAIKLSAKIKETGDTTNVGTVTIKGALS